MNANGSGVITTQNAITAPGLPSGGAPAKDATLGANPKIED